MKGKPELRESEKKQKELLLKKLRSGVVGDDQSIQELIYKEREKKSAGSGFAQGQREILINNSCMLGHVEFSRNADFCARVRVVTPRANFFEVPRDLFDLMVENCPHYLQWFLSTVQQDLSRYKSIYNRHTDGSKSYSRQHLRGFPHSPASSQLTRYLRQAPVNIGLDVCLHSSQHPLTAQPGTPSRAPRLDRTGQSFYSVKCKSGGSTPNNRSRRLGPSRVDISVLVKEDTEQTELKQSQLSKPRRSELKGNAFHKHTSSLFGRSPLNNSLPRFDALQV